MRNMYRMTQLGLPQIRIYRDGSLFDERRNMPIVPQPSCGKIEIANPKTHKRVRIPYDFAYGYYFRAPWRNDVDNRWLSKFGFSKYFVTKDGRVFSTLTWNYLVGNMSFDGYLRALIKRDDGKFVTIGVHRLVAMAYIPNPDNKPEVNHIDGNKLNNCADNLEWVWGWENVEHARRMGIRKAVVTDDQIHKICKMLEDGHSISEIEEQLNVAGHVVRGILEGCHFRISKDYNIRRCRHFGAGHRSREASDECYRIARKTHEVNLQPSSSDGEGSETIPEGSRDKCPEAVAT